MPSQRTESQRIDANRVAWRSRRGLLELDLLLPPFASARFDTLTPELAQAYCALLEQEDQDILRWLQGIGQPSDPRFIELVTLIRDFNTSNTPSAR